MKVKKQRPKKVVRWEVNSKPHLCKLGVILPAVVLVVIPGIVRSRVLRGVCTDVLRVVDVHITINTCFERSEKSRPMASYELYTSWIFWTSVASRARRMGRWAPDLDMGGVGWGLGFVRTGRKHIHQLISTSKLPAPRNTCTV